MFDCLSVSSVISWVQICCREFPPRILGTRLKESMKIIYSGSRLDYQQHDGITETDVWVWEGVCLKITILELV